MMKLSLVLNIAILLFWLSSCSGSLPELTGEQIASASVRWPGTSVETLHNGRQLYIAKCSGCHSLYDPSRFSELKWNEVMPIMAHKAKLRAEEDTLILRYVLSFRKTLAQERIQ